MAIQVTQSTQRIGVIDIWFQLIILLVRVIYMFPYPLQDCGSASATCLNKAIDFLLNYLPNDFEVHAKPPFDGCQYICSPSIVLCTFISFNFRDECAGGLLGTIVRPTLQLS